jgi:hypothetical protein
VSREENYIRLYHAMLADPSYRAVLIDGPLFGAFLQLAIAADLSFPQPAGPPPYIDRTLIERLVQMRRVKDAGGGEYRVPFIDADRLGRYKSASKAARKRWDDERERKALLAAEASAADADAYAPGMQMHMRGGCGLMPPQPQPQPQPEDVPPSDRPPVRATSSRARGSKKGNGATPTGPWHIGQEPDV